MENLPIFLLGFAGQAFFGSRLLIQWWISEKSARVVSPVIYWYLSLLGSLVFLGYGLLRADAVIIAGQAISYFIYVRNLQLKNAWLPIQLALRNLILTAPAILIAIFLYVSSPEKALSAQFIFDPFMIMGAIGQLALNLRFVYQWYFSEKFKTSILPYGFWSISTWASVLVIVYSAFHPIYKFEPVLFVSQLMGIVVYIRNMILSRRKPRETI